MSTPKVAPAPVAPKDAPLDIDRIRADFPILRQQVHGKPLVYLDSANTAQKPQAVIDAEARVYREIYANVHRGVYDLSMKAEKAFEGARHTVQRAASTSMSMSASVKALAWKCATGLPKALRSWVYSSASS